MSIFGLIFFFASLQKTLVLQEKYEDSLVVSRYCYKVADWYFYDGLAKSQLFRKDEAILALKRYLQVGKNEGHLFVAERLVEQLSDEVSAMEDINQDMKFAERRLRLNKVGKDVIDVQKRIISKLDAEIAALEQQMSKSQNQQGNQSQQEKSAEALKESKIMEQAGNGDVTKKKLITSNDLWGNLPPKEKTKALESIGRQIPAHIREAAEGFSKKLNNPK